MSMFLSPGQPLGLAVTEHWHHGLYGRGHRWWQSAPAWPLSEHGPDSAALRRAAGPETKAVAVAVAMAMVSCQEQKLSKPQPGY